MNVNDTQQQQESQRRADLTKRLKQCTVPMFGKVLESDKTPESKERNC